MGTTSFGDGEGEWWVSEDLAAEAGEEFVAEEFAPEHSAPEQSGEETGAE